MASKAKETWSEIAERDIRPAAPQHLDPQPAWTVPAPLRRTLLALVLLGTAGLILELILLEHYESAWQWAPLVLLGVALVSGTAVAARPSAWTVRVFEALMALCVVVGLLGLYLHYRGNVEFELERDPSVRGLALFWEALRGATPALAPGAMAQLGLLGLIVAYRHPSLRRSSLVRTDPADAAPRETR